MQVKRVKLDSIKGAKHNPKGRIDAEKLKGLIRSIEEIGLVYPISISKDNVIIDGHRRHAACKSLGWEEIPVLVTEGNTDKIYAEVNSNAKIFDGCQTLEVWLKRPSAVVATSAKLFARMEETYGRELLEMLVKKGSSVRVIQRAENVGRYVDDTSVAFVKRAVRWMVKFRMVQVVQAYLRLQQSPALIHKAIVSGKELKSTFKTSR